MKARSRQEVEDLGRSGVCVEEVDGLTRCRVLDSFWMYVDPKDVSLAGCLMRDGYWESWITSWILRNVDPGSRCIDLGANFGYFTLLLASMGCSVIAFEPQPRVAEMLRRAVEVNGYGESVTIIEKAVVAPGCDSVVLNVPDTYLGSAYIGNQVTFDHLGLGGLSQSTITVPTTTLDDFAETPIDFLKVDVEGAEQQVLAGGKRFLETNCNATWILEWEWSRYPDPAGFAAQLLDDFSVGYVGYQGETVPVRRDPEALRAPQGDDLSMLVLAPPSETLASFATLAPVKRHGRREMTGGVPVEGGTISPDDWRLDYAANVPKRAPGFVPGRLPLRSESCSAHHFLLEAYDYWAEKMGESPRFHRRQWEFVYVAQALFERGMLQPGRRGVGVRRSGDPLVALCASLGCSILATDFSEQRDVVPPDGAVFNELFRPGVCEPERFRSRVSVTGFDPSALLSDPEGFDFCWSVGVMHSLGSIGAGLQFVEETVAALRPGGVAVHTTEHLLDPGENTVEEGPGVIFRRSDLQALSARLEANGAVVEPLVVHRGSHPVDDYIDAPPYRAAPHLRLQLMGHTTTSIGFIVQKR